MLAGGWEEQGRSFQSKGEQGALGAQIGIKKALQREQAAAAARLCAQQ